METSPPSPSFEEIADLAFELWVAEGHPEGKAEEHWEKAERQLRGRHPSPRSDSPNEG